MQKSFVCQRKDLAVALGVSCAKGVAKNMSQNHTELMIAILLLALSFSLLLPNSQV